MITVSVHVMSSGFIEVAIRIRAKGGVWTIAFLTLASGFGWSQAGGAQLSNDGAMRSPDAPGISDSNFLRPTDTGVPISPAPSSIGTSSIGVSPEASRSYFRGGIQVSQGEASNPAGYTGGSSQLASVANVLGSFSLQKLRRRTVTAIEYAGGGTFYGSYRNIPSYRVPIQQLSVDEQIRWKRGGLVFSDSLQHLSGSNFGAPSLGGASTYNLRFAAIGSRARSYTGSTDFFGGSQLIDLGRQSYLTNVSGADITEALTPRSSVFVAGAYALTDYLGNTKLFIDSRQISMQAGYAYLLNPRDQIALVYGYQTFSFVRSATNDVATNSAQVVYRHRLSDRTKLVLGGGPQIARVGGGINGSAQQIDATIQAAVDYRLEKSSLAFSYNHLVTAGSGLFAGGNSDILGFFADRNIFRNWQTTWSAGYARAGAIGPSSLMTSRNSYRSFFAGTAVERRLGPQFNVFASYQFGTESFDGSVCSVSAACDGGLSQRHTALIGFGWHIRPIRLD